MRESSSARYGIRIEDTSDIFNNKGRTVIEEALNTLPEQSRFAAQLASYAATTPRVHASGRKLRRGHTAADTNHSLKWAFAEASNTIMQVLAAVSRHPAEATWSILTKQEPYRESLTRF